MGRGVCKGKVMLNLAVFLQIQSYRTNQSIPVLWLSECLGEKSDSGPICWAWSKGTWSGGRAQVIKTDLRHQFRYMWEYFQVFSILQVLLLLPCIPVIPSTCI